MRYSLAFSIFAFAVYTSLPSVSSCCRSNIRATSKSTSLYSQEKLATKFQSLFSRNFTTGTTPGPGLKRLGSSMRVKWVRSGPARNRFEPLKGPRNNQRKNLSTNQIANKSKWRLGLMRRTTHTLRFAALALYTLCATVLL